MTAPRLVSAGNVTIDDIVFADGRTRWAQPGGAALYAALAARLAGAEAAVAAVVGADYPLVLPALTGIDFSPSRRVAATMRNWGLYEEDGSRHFVFRTASRPHEAFCPEPAALSRLHADAVHLAPMPWSLQVRLARAARSASASAIVSLDAHDRALADVTLDALATGLVDVDAFLPSRQELDVLGLPADSSAALIALRRACPNVPLLVAKLGVTGALLHERGQRHFLKVPSAVDTVVDPTGAGDAFCGAFAARYASARDPVEALAAATVAAAFAVEGQGFDALAAATPSDAASRAEEVRTQIETVAETGLTDFATT